MKNYKQQFKGKKITIMGLGILGRGLGYTKFLAECGADLIVTDLKTEKQLASSLKELRKFKNPKGKQASYGAGIKFVLGEHRLEDFRNRDMIIKAAGVPIESIYIKEAKKNRIPVEMDVSLFAKCAPGVMIIGVTGTRGKSMTTTLIYKILSAFAKASAGRRKQKDKFWAKNPSVFLGGNLRGVATLPLLKKVKDGDILVCELDSWQLQGFGEAKISPHISVFTTFMPDHMNYYKNSMEKYFDDKANIFKYQTKEDILIIRPGMKEPGSRFWQSAKHADKSALPKFTTGKCYIKKSDVKGKLIVVNPKEVENWKFNVPGMHHRENLACAVAVAQALGVPKEAIKKTIADFKDLEGRLQLLRTYKGIKIYNDNNATTPEATIAGIEALTNFWKSDFQKSGSPTSRNLGKRKIILICGGSDKGLPLDNFVKTVNKYCKEVILIPGSGTEKLITNYQLLITNEKTKNLKDAVKIALGKASRGEIILFSPAFASFGVYNNEYERNDLFMKIIRNLK